MMVKMRESEDDYGYADAYQNHPNAGFNFFDQFF
jgi:hypothetical protein